MNEPLVSEDDNEESQQGLHRSTSLLERIRAQREREAASSEEQNNNHNDDVETNTGPPVNIPNYAPIANDAMGGGGEPAAASSSWSSAFSSFSMNFGGGGGAAGAPGGSSTTQGLLSPDGSSPDNYSMTEYFNTFVMDIYGLFRSLPILAQAVLVVFLLWVAWKLL
jgi:hypothetical protein